MGRRVLLKEYVTQDISKREMYMVIFQITKALIESEGSRRQLILDLENMEMENGVVVHEYSTDGNINTIKTITEFVKEIVFRCVFRIGEELEDLADFLEFLDDSKVVTLEYIYEYVADELDISVDINLNQSARAVEPERSENAYPERPQQLFGAGGFDNFGGNDFEVFSSASRPPMNPNTRAQDMYNSGMVLGSNQGETGVLDVSFWEQNSVLKDATKIQQNNSQRLRGQTGNSGQMARGYQQNSYAQPSYQQSGYTPPATDETGVLDESFWEQEMNSQRLSSQSKVGAMVTKNIALVNEKSGEESRIRKNVYVIGKDSNVADLVIRNKTVSRKHAEISIRGSRYYIRDNGSLNKTFVDGTEIPPETFVEIFNGTRIKISNEMFRFVVG